MRTYPSSGLWADTRIQLYRAQTNLAPGVNRNRIIWKLVQRGGNPENRVVSLSNSENSFNTLLLHPSFKNIHVPSICKVILTFKVQLYSESVGFSLKTRFSLFS